jgi:phytoene dehydrogenase-like protein
MPEPLEFSSEPAELRFDAVVVGAGPNGLAAAITVARAGRSVLVVEAAETIGGGTRSAELTLPGFVHDVCSAVHALGVASPLFKSEVGPAVAAVKVQIRTEQPCVRHSRTYDLEH